MENKKSISKLFELYKEDIYKMDSTYYNILKNVQEQENIFYQTLSDNQKELLENLNMYKTEQDNYIHQHIFTYGYSLANNLLIESITTSNIKKTNTTK